MHFNAKKINTSYDGVKMQALFVSPFSFLFSRFSSNPFCFLPSLLYSFNTQLKKKNKQFCPRSLNIYTTYLYKCLCWCVREWWGSQFSLVESEDFLEVCFGTSDRRKLRIVPCHSCHIYGNWMSRSKEVWGTL